MDFLVLGLLCWSCVAATRPGSTLQTLQARIDPQETKQKGTAQETLLDVFLSKADQGSIARDHWDGELGHFDLMDTNADQSLTAAEFEAALKTFGQTESSFVQTSTSPTNVPCWKSSYAVATATAVCPSGQNYVAGLCYPPCPTGWSQVSFVCYSPCPAGWIDEGALCSNGGTISANTAACPWYDACCLTFARGQSVCPSGWTNNGCTCYKTLTQTNAKQSQAIVGKAPNVCPAGFNLVGLGPVCSQNSCKSGFNLVAGVCWTSCGSDFDCGGICTANSASCNSIVTSVAAGSAGVLAGAAATIGTVGAAAAPGVITIVAGVAGLTASLSLPLCA